MDDEGLAKRSAAGDREAFARLYDRYAGRVYAYHFYRSFGRETAEDLTSQTFLKALEGMSLWRAERGAFSAWLFGIARNCLIDRVRSRARAAGLEGGEGAEPFDGWDLPAPADFEHDLAQRDLWERLKPHLLALGPEAREIIIMRLWDGLAHAQIAAILGRSEASCKMSYSRSLALLRDAMPAALLVAFLLHRPLSGQ